MEILISLIVGLLVGVGTCLVIALDRSKERSYKEYMKIGGASAILSGIFVWLALSGFLSMKSGNIKKGGSTQGVNYDLEVAGNLPNF